MSSHHHQMNQSMCKHCHVSVLPRHNAGENTACEHCIIVILIGILVMSSRVLKELKGERIYI